MKKENLFVFIFFLSLCLFVYRNCFDIFIPGDSYSHLYFFKNGFYKGIIDSIHIGEPPYFAEFPLLFFLYKICGINPGYWMCVFLPVHTLNAFLVFLIANKLIELIFSRNGFIVAFFSGLIFLISPYQTENVLWLWQGMRLFHASVTLLGIYIFIFYLSNPSVKKLMIIHFLFLLGLFSYEFTFVVPAIYFGIYFLFKKMFLTKFKLNYFFQRILFIQLIFIGCYFLCCKYFSGHWLWHGRTINLVVPITFYIKTLLKYFAKFFLFYRYLPVGKMDILLRNFSQHYFLLSVFLIFVVVGFLFFFARLIKRKKEEGYFLSAIFICFLISLLPVLPLDSCFMNYVYPDRYGYLPSVFFYIFLVAAIFFLFQKFAVPFLLGYSVLCWVLLSQTISQWNSTNDYCNKLIKNYQPFLKYNEVYVLNAPSYYNGVAAFRASFPEAIYMKYKVFGKENINVISGTYQNNFSDTLSSIKISGKGIQVTCPKKNTPYFCINGWPTSYETNEYTVAFDSSKCAYLFSFKDTIPRNSAIIYTSNGEWKKIN